MRTSTERILTTHVGSLPRSKAVTEVLFARERKRALDEESASRIIAKAVGEVVARQADAGLDILSDGEMSKISYATYIRQRLTGFEGDSPQQWPEDLEAFPNYLQRKTASTATPPYSRPCCVDAVSARDLNAVNEDIRNFAAALDAVDASEGFMAAASPGAIALFHPNHFYPDHEAYIAALAEAMSAEYEAIVAAGYLLQLDCPDLALGRHMMFKDRSDEEFLDVAQMHVDALNEATQEIPPERMRLHVCWGNYEGPHHCDAALSMILPVALRARPQALLFESSNPRHAHEWKVFQGVSLPQDKVLVPGLIGSTTNYIEHPEWISDRICRYADLVGRERLIAGADCGFSNFAGTGTVDDDIVYAKLAVLAEGARLASKRLWP